MVLIGIDPGASGAIAKLINGKLAGVWDMPVLEVRGKRRTDANALASIVREISADHAYIEEVGAMPGQGVTSMFSFGRSAGIIEGVLAALLVPVTPVRPAQWKMALRVPAGKDGARARATQLLPEAAQHWQRKKDDGRAEAAMIALWGHKQGLGKDAVEW